MIKAASLNLDIDLLSYSQFLSQQGLKYRIVEESGKQSIYVSNNRDVDFVQQSLQYYIDKSDIDAEQYRKRGKGNLQLKKVAIAFLVEFVRSPATLTLISISILTGVITSLGNEVIRLSFLFYPLISSSNLISLLSDINSLKIALNTLTPMFLHFGELHLVFNMLWLWYFGRQLENIQPIWIFIFLVVATSFVSNTTQYLAIGYNNFGGMSGVVYGLVGYTWVIHALMPRSSLLINTNMFVFFVVALVLMEVIASSWIATAAHIGGLLSGLVIGLGVVMYYRIVLQKTMISRNH